MKTTNPVDLRDALVLQTGAVACLSNQREAG